MYQRTWKFIGIYTDYNIFWGHDTNPNTLVIVLNHLTESTDNTMFWALHHWYVTWSKKLCLFWTTMLFPVQTTHHHDTVWHSITSEGVGLWEWHKPERLDLQEVIDCSGQLPQNPVYFLQAEGQSSVVVSSLMEPDALLMDGWLGTQLHKDYWAGRHWDTATLSERLN